MPLACVRIGTIINNTDVNPAQGGKLVRAAGTLTKILRKNPLQVSNPSHGAKKLSKAGQRSWLGRRAVVRGVAMIPVDHPHVERSKSSGNNGRCSLTPWGKP
ncbi:hypothetical protein CUMW_287120, partial [Citrus unshiu]